MKKILLILKNSENALCFKSRLSEAKKVLRSRLIPTILVDYMTFSFKEKGTLYSFVDDIKKVFPNIIIKDRSRFTNPNFNRNDPEQKIAHEKEQDNLGLPVLHLVKSEYAHSFYHVAVPGWFAQQVFNSIMSGNLKIDLKNTVKLTRIDFLVNIEGFLRIMSINFNEQLSFLEDFFLLQTDLVETIFKRIVRVELRKELKKGYAIVYSNSRVAMKMLRTYVSGMKKTFEIELKRDGVKLYHHFLADRDIYSLNKRIVLEFLDQLEKTAICSYTKNLFIRKTAFLKPLYQDCFPLEVYDSKKKNKKEDLERLKRLKPFLKTNTNFFNLNVVNVLGYQNLKAMRALLTLSFCTKILLKKWTSLSSEHLLDKIHFNERNDLFLKDRLFVHGDEFRVEFFLKEFVIFLGLDYNTYARKLVLKLLEDLFIKSLDFRIHDTFYKQHFINFLEVDSQRGTPVKIRLILHPFVIYGFLKSLIFLDQTLLEKYYSICDQESSLKKVSYRHTCLLRVLISFSIQSSDPLKAELSSMNFSNSDYRKQHGRVFFKICEEIGQLHRLQLGVKINEEIIFLKDQLSWEKLVLKLTKKRVQEMEFVFLSYSASST